MSEVSNDEKEGCCFIANLNDVDILVNGLILSPILQNMLRLSAPRGQELIFPQGTCCSGFLCPCKRGWRWEVKEYAGLTPPLFP